MSAGIIQKSLSDATSDLKRVWFTSMDAAAPLDPLSGSLSFTVRLLKADGTSVAGGGTITQPDSSNAAGVRYYTPSSGDLSVTGVSCVVISADGMIRREVPFDVQDRNPYNTFSGGYSALPDVTAGAGDGALITAISAADRAGNSGSGSEIHMDGEGNPEVGQGTMEFEKYKTEIVRAWGVMAHGTLAAATSNTLTLDTDAPATDHALVGATVHIYGLTASQPRRIIAYTAGRVATVFPAYTSTPAGTEGYVVHSTSGHTTSIADSAIAVASLANGLQKALGILHASVLGVFGASPGLSITLGLGASGVNDAYNGKMLVLGDEALLIDDYVGATKVATLNAATPLVGTYIADAPYAVLAHLAGGDATLANQVTLLARITSARAGYIDNLNVGGLVASSAEATAIQNNTRVVRVVPPAIAVPEAGTTTYKVRLYLYDSVGNMEVPDVPPTITLTNAAGTSRAARLSSTAMTSIGTGQYEVSYTSTAGDASEQLLWNFTVTEGGVGRLYPDKSFVGASDSESLIAALLDAIGDEIVDDTGPEPHPTVRGQRIRLEAFMSNKATGMNGPMGDWKRRDNSTSAFTGAVDPDTGTRGRTDISGSEE